MKKKIYPKSRVLAATKYDTSAYDRVYKSLKDASWNLTNAEDFAEEDEELNNIVSPYMDRLLMDIYGVIYELEQLKNG